MRINGRVGGWDAASSERHPSFLRYRSAERVNTPSRVLAPPRRWIFRINNLIRQILQTASQLSFVLSLSPFPLPPPLSLSLPLLTFQLFSFYFFVAKPFNQADVVLKEKLDVKKHVWKTVKLYTFSSFSLIKIFELQIYITIIFNENDIIYINCLYIWILIGKYKW